MDITRDQMRFLDICKVTTLPDTNNVRVSFSTMRPSVTIGRKQLVVLLEQIAGEFRKSNYPAIHRRAATLAATTRDHLWPRQDA
jgi:hypothetical protein